MGMPMTLGGKGGYWLRCGVGHDCPNLGYWLRCGVGHDCPKLSKELPTLEYLEIIFLFFAFYNP